MTTPPVRYTVYTDGSLKMQIYGAYGYIILRDDEIIHQCVEKVKDVTINHLELTAILTALEYFTKPTSLQIYSDSQYAVFCVTKWTKGWMRNDWLTQLGAPVKNKDLLVKIYEQTKKHKVTLQWVRGHAGDKHNQIVDDLVQKATREMIATSGV